MKTTVAQSKINDLTKINSDLSLLRTQVAAQRNQNVPLFMLLTEKIVLNERRIKELQSS